MMMETLTIGEFFNLAGLKLGIPFGVIGLQYLFIAFLVQRRDKRDKEEQG